MWYFLFAHPLYLASDVRPTLHKLALKFSPTPLWLHLFFPHDMNSPKCVKETQKKKKWTGSLDAPLLCIRAYFGRWALSRRRSLWLHQSTDSILISFITEGKLVWPNSCSFVLLICHISGPATISYTCVKKNVEIFVSSSETWTPLSVWMKPKVDRIFKSPTTYFILWCTCI